MCSVVRQQTHTHRCVLRRMVCSFIDSRIARGTYPACPRRPPTAVRHFRAPLLPHTYQRLRHHIIMAIAGRCVGVSLRKSSLAVLLSVLLRSSSSLTTMSSSSSSSSSSCPLRLHGRFWLNSLSFVWRGARYCRKPSSCTSKHSSCCPSFLPVGHSGERSPPHTRTQAH